MANPDDLNARLAQMALNLVCATGVIADMKSLRGTADPNYHKVKQMADDIHPVLIKWFNDNDAWLQSLGCNLHTMRMP